MPQDILPQYPDPISQGRATLILSNPLSSPAFTNGVAVDSLQGLAAYFRDKGRYNRRDIWIEIKGETIGYISLQVVYSSAGDGSQWLPIASGSISNSTVSNIASA